MLNFEYAKQTFHEMFPKTLPVNFALAKYGVYSNKNKIELFVPLDCIISNEFDGHLKTQCIATVQIPSKSLIVKPDKPGFIRSNETIVTKISPAIEKFKNRKIVTSWIPSMPTWTEKDLDIYFVRYELGKTMLEEIDINHSHDVCPTDLKIYTEEEALASFSELQEIPIKVFPFQYNNYGNVGVYIGDDALRT